MANNVTIGRAGIVIKPWGVIPTSLSVAAACVVTYTAHGLDTGDIVSFNRITQANWTALNNQPYTVTWLSANTFSIPVDTLAFGAYTDTAGMVYENFNSLDLFPDGFRVAGFSFIGSATNDLLIVRNKTYNGQELIKRADTSGNGFRHPIGLTPTKCKPYILMSECVFGRDPSDATITIEIA